VTLEEADLADIMLAVQRVEHASADGWCELLGLVSRADDHQLDRIITAANDLAAAAREIDGWRHG